MFSVNTIRKQDARKAQNKSSVCPDGSRMQMLFEKMRKEQDSMLLQGMIWRTRDRFNYWLLTYQCNLNLPISLVR